MAEPLLLGEGAVAVIDALGFKRIWERHKPADVIATLRESRQHARDDQQWHNEQLTLGAYEAVGVRLFSDAVIITCPVSAGTPTVVDTSVPPRMAVMAVVRATLLFIARAVERNVPLVYRGCISFGPLLAEGDFFVGRAVDEAAEWAEKANAAVVWLLPSALAVVDDRPRSELVPCDVPLKVDGALATRIVNPCWLTGGEENESLIQRYLAVFGERLPVDVQIKKQNTERALRLAAAHPLGLR